jgi:DNA-binding response OmpR family regulator
MKAPVIAWIEDESDVIYGVVRPLIKEGFQIKQYFTYSDAIDAIDEIAQADLILLDVILPPGNATETGKNLGLDFLRRLRDEFKLSMPVLLFSIVANARDVIDAKELTRLKAHSIPKPTSPKDLKAEVKDLLGL